MQDIHQVVEDMHLYAMDMTVIISSILIGAGEAKLMDIFH